MIYRVLLDGMDIYDPTKKDMVLYNAVVKTAVSEAGSFEFIMPPGHVFYDSIVPYGSDIEVLEDGVSIFYGRPLKPTIGFYNQKTYHCEGALAFLNDTRPVGAVTHDHTSYSDYFRLLITEHNALQQYNSNRHFTIGYVSIEHGDMDIYREMDPSQTIFDHIKRGCIGSDGGYIFTRRENGVNYIDWIDTMPYTCNQVVEFAVNLLDMARSPEDDVYTGLYLQGKDVSYGPLWANETIRGRYGDILGYQEYKDETEQAGLIARGEIFLGSQQFESMCFEISAAEQHYLNVSLNAFRVGQKVHLLSDPHFVDMELPVWSVEYNLNSAEKKVVIGTPKRQTLTKIQRKENDDQNDRIDDNASDISDLFTQVEDLQDWTENPVITGDDGIPYNIGVAPGGDVYATPAYTSIYIAEYPMTVWFNRQDTYDWTGLKVMGVRGDGVEEDITNQCIIDPAQGDAVNKDDGHYQATVTWTAKNLSTSFEFTVGILEGSIIEVQFSGNAAYHDGENRNLIYSFTATARGYCMTGTKWRTYTRQNTSSATSVTYLADTRQAVCVGEEGVDKNNQDWYKYGLVISMTGQSVISGTFDGEDMGATYTWVNTLVDAEAPSSSGGIYNLDVYEKNKEFFDEQLNNGNKYHMAAYDMGVLPYLYFNGYTNPDNGHIYYPFYSRNDTLKSHFFGIRASEPVTIKNFAGPVGFSTAYHWAKTDDPTARWGEFYSRITSVRIVEQ